VRKIKVLSLLILKYLQRYLTKFVREPHLLHSQHHLHSRRLPKLNYIYQKYKIYLLLISCFILVIIYRREILNRLVLNTLNEGVIGLYQEQKLPGSVAGLLSKPLISLDKSGKYKGELLDNWQVNQNATVYTLKLKDYLFWSDGSQLISSDIKLNIPNSKVVYPDNKTLEITLNESYSSLPTLLTSPIFKADSLIGTGPYFITKLEKFNEVITKINLSPSNNRDLPNLNIRFYPDEKTTKTAFNLGEIDAILDVSETRDFLNQPSVDQINIPVTSKIVAIFYNTKDPTLSDRNLRKSLNSATARVEGEARSLTSISTFSWVYNDALKDNLANPDLAHDYLNKFLQNSKLQNISLITTPNLSILGEKIIRSWKEIGISSVLRVESGIPQNFQALLITADLPPDPDQYLLWHSSQTLTNLSKLASPRIDRDIEDARKSNDSEFRRERYLDFQKSLLDEMPATFLYFPKTNVIYRKKIKNLLEKVLPLQNL